MPRYFTPEEANRALARVGPLMEDLVERRRALREPQQVLADFKAKARQGGGARRGPNVAEARKAIDRITSEMRRLATEIQEGGAEIKDLDMGLLDFRALRDGREVYLCWRVGENRITHWHGLEEGFAGRKPLRLDDF